MWAELVKCSTSHNIHITQHTNHFVLVVLCCCRVRGEAVCSTWRLALRDLPLLSLELSGPARRGAACGKLQWVLHRRPEAKEVSVVNTPAPWQAGEVSAALYAVQREVRPADY